MCVLCLLCKRRLNRTLIILIYYKAKRLQYQLSSASLKTIIKKDLSCSNVGSQEMSTELLKKKKSEKNS